MIDETIENYRDRMWRRDPELMVETAMDAESFVESVGFAYALTDLRWPCPSLYIAVCGRRDVQMPRNVQKDPEASHAWVLKDEVLRRGKVYYAKLANGRATFIAPRLLSAFSTIWGIPRSEEKERLSKEALSILRVLRKEWEMASADLREASGIGDRTRFSKAMDELQACFKVIPGEVLYVPKFTYIWYLTEGRFERKLLKPIERKKALTEIARAYLTTVGETGRGQLARITGLSRTDAGKGNHALVAEGYAERLAVGVYRLSSLGENHKDTKTQRF
jgi:hypothetical protein